MTDWKPIETAPKTGCYILLARDISRFDDESAMEGFWREGALSPDKVCLAGWVMSIDPDTPYPVKPTHWQPLPEPPT